MTAENFCYFLQGYLETSNPELIGPTQTSLIKRKLEGTINPTYIVAQSAESLKPIPAYSPSFIGKITMTGDGNLC